MSTPDVVAFGGGADLRPRIPKRFDIVRACVQAQHQDALALVVDDGAAVRRLSFGGLNALAAAAAGGLLAAGAEPGDRVALMLPQGAEFAAALLGAIGAGLIAVPISSQFGPDGLAYRLRDSDAAVLVTDGEGSEKLAAVRQRLDRPPATILADGIRGWPGSAGTWAGAGASAAESPALIIYTSGSTGNPKGVLHAHRAVLGQAPGLRLAFESSPPGGLFWTPSDWPWVTLALLGIWCQGRPVLAAARRGFDPGWAWSVLARNDVRVTFMTPTAVRMLAQAGPHAPVAVRSVLCGGEPTGEDLHRWCREHLDADLVGVYGQTEADILIGDCPTRRPVTPGAMGRPYPGHRVEVVEPDGRLAPIGTPGELVLQVPDPALMLEYWRQPEATARKVREGKLWTGDEVVADERGDLWFQHRTDDIIKSAGYRVGPGEIEECLLGHPAVAGAAVIGVPDPVRGQVIKAFVLLAPGEAASAALEGTLRERVKASLAGYQQPRIIEFVGELPMTLTGKVNRAELRRREPTVPAG